MTERDPGEGERPDAGEPRESGKGGEGASSLPPEEEAAWKAIVAAYGEEPSLPETGRPAGSDEGGTLTTPRPGPDGEPPVRSFTVYSAGTGPRDWSPSTAGEGDEDDEGHFEPPEPPPLPQTDTTTKFAWLAAVGGPLLLLGAILLQADLTWWIVTLGVGGFLGGFATLLTRLRDGRDDDDWDDPGRGAVV
ncbi:hypothetical protein ACF1DY_19370 [Streptomyces albus]|uniref:hypothetical protein n=1 Tax=Streptomyces albus TaxID=1888 RepID=UPI0036FF7ED6